MAREQGKKEKGGRSPVSQILSPPPLRRSMIISLPACAGARLRGLRLIPGDTAGGQPFPCSVLHHARFAVPRRLPGHAVGFYPTLSPLPDPLRAIGGMLSAALSVRQP